MARSVATRIDAIFANGAEPDPDWLRSFVSSLSTSLKVAERATSHNFAWLFLTWAIAAAIGSGLISGGSFMSFNLEDTADLLIVAPPVVAFFGYRYLLYLTVGVLLWHAISLLYKHKLPKVYEQDLEVLVEVGTTLSAQRAIAPDAANKVQQVVYKVWLGVIIVGGVVGPLLATLHISYLLWRMHEWSPWWIGASVTVAILIFVRTIFGIRSFVDSYLP